MARRKPKTDVSADVGLSISKNRLDINGDLTVEVLPKTEADVSESQGPTIYPDNSSCADIKIEENKMERKIFNNVRKRARQAYARNQYSRRERILIYNLIKERNCLRREYNEKKAYLNILKVRLLGASIKDSA